MDPNLSNFLYGVAGGVVIEAIKYRQVMIAGGQRPARYGKASYWVATGIIVLAGGLVAMAYRPDSAILAIHVGASAPLIVQAGTAQKPPPPADAE